MDIINTKYEELISGCSNLLFRKPNMRQDAWWVTTALSNILILQELKDLKKTISELNSTLKNTKNVRQTTKQNDIIKRKNKKLLEL